MTQEVDDETTSTPVAEPVSAPSEARAMQSACVAVLAAAVLQRRGWRMAQSMRNRADWLIERSEFVGLDPMQVANYNMRTRGVKA